MIYYLSKNRYSQVEMLPMKKDITLSVILPIQNTTDALLPLIEECLHVVPQHVSDYEIIMVNDHSNEETLTITNNLVANYDPVMLRSQRKRHGYGNALLTGAEAARGEYILALDADGQVVLNDLEYLISYLGDYDLITGYRLQPQLPWHQRLAEHVLNIIFKLDLRDTGYHLSLVRTSFLQSIPLTMHGPLVLLELLIYNRHDSTSSIRVGLPASLPSIPTASGYAQPNISAYQELIAFLLRETTTRTPRKRWIRRMVLGVGLYTIVRGIRIVQGRQSR